MAPQLLPCLLCLLCSSVLAFIPQSPTHRGRRFVLGFMENEPWGNNAVLPPQLLVSSLGPQATVRVSTPLLDRDFHLVASASNSARTALSLLPVLAAAGSALENKGVLVEADTDVEVLGLSKQTWSAEAFLALPVELLGTEYYAVTWKRASELLVVAVENGTALTVTLGVGVGAVNYQGSTLRSGAVLRFTMAAFQTWQLQAPQGDLTGTRILASKPVAVFSGAKKSDVQEEVQGGQQRQQSYNHLVEQLLPVHLWGSDYVTAPTPGRRQGGVLTLVAASPGTRIKVGTQRGGNNVVLPRPGTSKTIQLPDDQNNDLLTLTANKPFQAVMFAASPRGSRDPGFQPTMTILVPTANFLPSLSVLPLPALPSRLLVLASSSLIGTLDNSNFPLTPANWRLVQEDAALRGQSLTNLTQQLLVSSPSGTPSLMAYVFGQGNLFAMACPLGLAAPYSQVCVPRASMAAGDGVDNDCDGLIDEENDNGVDDDYDGLIDEDLRSVPDQCGQFECHRRGRCHENRCECQPPYLGEGRFTCAHPEHECQCATYGDPHTVDYNGEVLELPLQCRYALTQVTLPDCHVTLYMQGRPYGDNPLRVMLDTVHWDYGQPDVTAFSGYTNPFGVFFTNHSRVPFNIQDRVGSLLVTFRVDETGFYSVSSPCGVELRMRQPVVTIRRPVPMHDMEPIAEPFICGTCTREALPAATRNQRVIRMLLAIAPAPGDVSPIAASCSQTQAAIQACRTELREDVMDVCGDLLDPEGVFGRCGLSAEALHAMLANCVTSVCSENPEVHTRMQSARAQCSSSG